MVLWGDDKMNRSGIGSRGDISMKMVSFGLGSSPIYFENDWRIGGPLLCLTLIRFRYFDH